MTEMTLVVVLAATVAIALAIDLQRRDLRAVVRRWSRLPDPVLQGALDADPLLLRDTLAALGVDLEVVDRG